MTSRHLLEGAEVVGSVESPAAQPKQPATKRLNVATAEVRLAMKVKAPPTPGGSRKLHIVDDAMEDAEVLAETFLRL